jgi:hypothetical protein
MSHPTDITHGSQITQQPASLSEQSESRTDWRWEADPLEPPPHEAIAREAIAREAIAREAYALYSARGYQDGWDVEDWLAAEESLRRPRRDEES